MGIGMMLSLASKIGDFFKSALNSVLSTLVNWIIVPILRMAINVIVILIKYLTSVVFLEISKFLLGLIDFVEALFRSLAGLDAKGNTGVSISMTLGGREGDLLISMLTSHEVIQAFYSTAIVGVFLLIITTIFQMIKVEYTTEGANNSKGGIIGKSLKSLCNMLIIPILCLLGVFIGNEVLDLIDTATGGGEGTTISAQLWVTAGSEALVAEDSLIKSKGGDGGELEGVLNSSMLMGKSIVLAFEKIFGNVMFSLTDEKANESSNMYDSNLGTPIADGDRAAAENQYASGALSIYSMTDLLKYYNPFEVNYLVLIFGACIIIKCLYHTCFGLIDRLYQCVALFIVMPMVVGMTPVKDSLGSWRGKFMSKALSAYGTVISLNLFFIIVKVMLNIDISVTGSTKGTAGILSMFSSSFWEGLIKAIMVIVGCLMIEKLAGDLGGYFGGGNAMADGKGLEKDAVSGVTNAAVAAGGVAMGIGKMAIKAGTGIAGKIKDSNIESGVNNKALETSVVASEKESAYRDSNKRLNDAMSKAGVDDATLSTYADISNDVLENQRISEDADKNIKDAEASKSAAQAVINDESSSMADRDAARQQIADADKAIADNTARKKKADDGAKTGLGMIADMKKDHKDIGSAYEALNESQSAKSDLDKANAANETAQKAQKDYYAQKDAEKQQKSAERKAKYVKAKEGVGQLLENKFGAGAMFNTFAPKPLQNLKKDYDSAVKTAMDASPEGQAMMGMLDKSKKDKAEADFDKRNAGAIETRHLATTQLILNTTNEKLEVTNKETNKELSKMNDTLLELINKMNKAKTEGDATSASMYASRIGNLQEAMIAKNGQIKFGDDLKVVSEEMLKVDFKMDANFMKKIEDQVTKGVKMDDIMEQISEEFKKMGINDKDTLAKIYKALDELRSNFSGK